MDEILLKLDIQLLSREKQTTNKHGINKKIRAVPVKTGKHAHK